MLVQSIAPWVFWSLLDKTVEGLMYLLVHDGSIFCPFYKRILMWFSKVFWYFSHLSNANPSWKKKTCSFYWPVGINIFGRKPINISSNDAIWNNFPFGKSSLEQNERKTGHGTSGTVTTSRTEKEEIWRRTTRYPFLLFRPSPFSFIATWPYVEEFKFVRLGFVTLFILISRSKLV